MVGNFESFVKIFMRYFDYFLANDQCSQLFLENHFKKKENTNACCEFGLVCGLMSQSTTMVMYRAL